MASVMGYLNAASRPPMKRDRFQNWRIPQDGWCGAHRLTPTLSVPLDASLKGRLYPDCINSENAINVYTASGLTEVGKFWRILTFRIYVGHDAARRTHWRDRLRQVVHCGHAGETWRAFSSG